MLSFRTQHVNQGRIDSGSVLRSLLLEHIAHNWHVLQHQFRRHVLISPPYKNDVQTPVPGVTSPVENLSCPESTRRCDHFVIPYTAGANPILRMGQGIVVSTLATVQCGANSVSEILGSRFETGTQLMKQFADNWHLRTLLIVSFIKYSISKARVLPLLRS